MPKTKLEQILGEEEKSDNAISLIASESRIKSIYACAFRCNECNGTGKKFDVQGNKFQNTQCGIPVRYFDCKQCGGSGLLDYAEFKALNLDQKIK